MSKQRLGLVARLLLSVALIALLFSLIDRQHFVEHLQNMNAGYFLLGLAVYILSVGFWAQRWQLFIRAVGERVSLRRVFLTTIIGIFFSMFLPTMVGTDLGRMYELSRDRDNKVGVVSTVLLDRLMGLMTLVLMAVAALLVGVQFTGDIPVRELVLVTGILMALGWLIFFNKALMRHFTWVFELPIVKQLEPTIRSLYHALHHLQSQPRLLLATALMSLLNQLTEVASVILIARALGIQVEPAYFFVFMPLIWLITMLPVSISGLGLREGVFAFFFTQVGASGAEAVAMSLLFYSYSVVVGAAGGVIFFRQSVVEYLNRRLVHRQA